MEPLKFYDVGLEKRRAFARHSRIKRIAALFRFFEFCLFLLLFSKYSPQISLLKFSFSGEYFRGVTLTLASPQFVFFVGNAIVVALLLGSAKTGGKPTDFYDEYVSKSQSAHRIRINYPDKENESLTRSCPAKLPTPTPTPTQTETLEVRRYLKRTRSGNFRKAAVDSGKKSPAEEVSSEEFRRIVEAFIERQQRFLREEE
ncbi:hypothetical protein M569_00213 [Genlisea aurea]|uniref:DUF4408 domain-containing protein n=1 Tax=Genlisea aurea TaxID=192259 RepID=S8D554_9LAMI|nr:hypothetical protein M569_00213 [Genlisea aurea]